MRCTGSGLPGDQSMRPLTRLQYLSTRSQHPSFSSAIWPLPDTPTLYERAGSPHTAASSGLGGRGRRSQTSMLRQPRRASMMAVARPVGPPPTTTVREGGGRSSSVSEGPSAGAKDTDSRGGSGAGFAMAPGVAAEGRARRVSRGEGVVTPARRGAPQAADATTRARRRRELSKLEDPRGRTTREGRRAASASERAAADESDGALVSVVAMARFAREKPRSD